MTEHLSAQIVERFHQHLLATDDRVVFYNHLLKCEACREQLVDPSVESFAFEAMSEYLVSENEHPDYEFLELYVDRQLARIDRDRLDAHLKTCLECLSEVTDLSDSIAVMEKASDHERVQQIRFLERIRNFVGPLIHSRPLRFSAIAALLVLAVVAAVVVWRLKSGGSVKGPDEQKLTAGSNPTPSPSHIQPGGSEPNPEPNPPKSAGRGPVRRRPARALEMVVLNDGSNRIVLDRFGRLIGLESLPSESQLAVKETLTTETLKKPAVLDELEVPDVSVRAPSENDENIRLVYPTKRVIEEDKPRFEWVPSKRARVYRVEIGNEGFHQVAKSEDLPPTTTSWIPTTALKRGEVYTWVVRAMNGEGKFSTYQAKFRSLTVEKMNQLSRLREARSRLALAVFYTREGMTEEAERELQSLTRDNPHSTIAKRLLQQVRSWKKR